MLNAQNLVGKRILGLLFGAGVGFIYSLVSATINHIYIRDIPLYLDASAVFNHVRLTTLAGAAMGYVVNWPEQGVIGVAVASLLGTLAMIITSVVNALAGGGQVAVVLLTYVYIGMPIAVMFIPLSGLFRWAAGSFQNNIRSHGWGARSLKIPMALVLLAILVGSFSLYSAEARKTLYKMNGYIQEAQVSGNEKIPAAFHQVAQIARQGGQDYTLEWSDDLGRFPMLLADDAGYSSFAYQVVLAHFKSGETIACLFDTDALLYFCMQARSSPGSQ
ncbi:MAG: hypothetical protein KJ606_03760 [Chloroflexi bacterium]|nr:hypothetical protein [Chloroflexota bacterium]